MAFPDVSGPYPVLEEGRLIREKTQLFRLDGLCVRFAQQVARRRPAHLQIVSNDARDRLHGSETCALVIRPGTGMKGSDVLRNSSHVRD